MKTKKTVKKAMKVLGIEKLHKHQIAPINSILDGTDTFVIAPTSAGKSAIFQVPALISFHTEQQWTLVIEPTLSLIYNQVETLNRKGICARYLTSDNTNDHENILTDLRLGEITFLYVTPERLQSLFFLSAVAHHNPGMVVVDEAHCVLNWGYTFRADYLTIGNFVKSLNCRPTIAALTATAPPSYRNKIVKHLKMKEAAIFVNDLSRKNISLMTECCSEMGEKKKRSLLNAKIKQFRNDGRTIVYCATKDNVDKIANFLSEKFPGEVVKCHSYMKPDKRIRCEKLFVSGEKHIMVATTAFGMGIDVPDIRLVIHYNLPLSVIDYYQQIGRAGRDGQRSRAILFYSPADKTLCEKILKQEHLAKSVSTELLIRFDELVSIMESPRCLMQQVLIALGQENASACRFCTNCQRDRRGDHED